MDCWENFKKIIFTVGLIKTSIEKFFIFIFQKEATAKQWNTWDEMRELKMPSANLFYFNPKKHAKQCRFQFFLNPQKIFSCLSRNTLPSRFECWHKNHHHHPDDFHSFSFSPVESFFLCWEIYKKVFLWIFKIIIGSLYHLTRPHTVFNGTLIRVLVKSFNNIFCVVAVGEKKSNYFACY